MIGFFLDPNHLLYDAAKVCRRASKLRGDLHVFLVDSMYYLHFSTSKERRRLLEAFDGKAFIIASWTPTIASAREQIFLFLYGFSFHIFLLFYSRCLV